MLKTDLLYIVIFFTLVNVSNSQLANQNTYLLKNLDSYGSSYSALWGYTAPNGREYAILGCNTGTSFVDITDSANIHEVDFQTGVTSQWREMKTYSHYAYIVSEGTNSYLQIIDLQYLPDSVHFVKAWNYSGYTKTHSIQQSGHYLYLNGGNSAANGGITVVDVISPETPVKLGQWTTLYVHDCRVRNDTIWASNIYTGQTSIINAVNKSSLSFVRTFQSYPTAVVSTHNSELTSDRKYLLTTNELSSPAGKLNVWNVEDLGNITFVRDWQPTGITNSIVHNVEIYGNYALIAHYTAGIRLLNISDPVNPVEAAWYDTYTSSNANTFNGCWAVYKFSSGKIIGSDISNGLFVIKTTVQDFNFPPVNINLKVFSEGLYNSSLNRLSRKDSVTVYLRNASSPFALVDSAKTSVDSINLSGNFKFSKAATGNYYIVVKYFNAIETWSRAGGEPLTAGGPVYSYDFTSAVSQAYGNNLLLKGSKYTMYSGDINKSGSIDLDDILYIYNDAGNFLSGIRIVSDLNADNLVDLSDITLSFNNSNNFISVKTPFNIVK
ncbi:MAG TPA: choice-of-anchor B family protein [Ignavibacteria bacterium]|nr:choice-of-anchor B family protein [Ignavibacteria bacterium]